MQPTTARDFLREARQRLDAAQYIGGCSVECWAERQIKCECASSMGGFMGSGETSATHSALAPPA